MTVGLRVDFLWYPIGTGDFFHSFFSTICYNLEYKIWGSKYPLIMNELYQGKVKCHDIKKIQKELFSIQKKLSKLPPEKVVWDIEDLEKKPPWGNNISTDIKNLADYFITSEGDNLIEIIHEAFVQSEIEHQDVIVELF